MKNTGNTILVDATSSATGSVTAKVTKVYVSAALNKYLPELLKHPEFVDDILPVVTDADTVQTQCKHGADTVQARCKHGASTVQARCLNALNPESWILDPGSGNLKPET